MKYIILLSLLVVFVFICSYQEGFGTNNNRSSYILLLREPNLDMMQQFTDYSKGYLAFDVSDPVNLNKFVNAYREVVLDIGAKTLVDVVNRTPPYTPSYLSVTVSADNAMLASAATAPTYTFTNTVYTGDTYEKHTFSGATDMKHANGIMLFKEMGATKWTILANEVSSREVCKIKSACT